MYGRSISRIDPDKIIFQYGKIHIEIPYEKDKLYGNFLNNGIGFSINQDKKLIEQCIKEKSNNPYWEKYKYYNEKDLRSPKNREVLIKILKEFKLDNLMELMLA